MAWSIDTYSTVLLQDDKDTTPSLLMPTSSMWPVGCGLWRELHLPEVRALAAWGN